MDNKENPKELFQSKGYLIIRDFFEAKSLYEYSRWAGDRYLRGEDTNKPVVYGIRNDLADISRIGFYRDPVMEQILIKLLPKVEALVGLELYKTYSFWRLYKKGDILRKHRDRYACEISVTMTVGYDGPRPWPIYAIDKNQKQVRVDLEAGDALIYKGIEMYHWRDANGIDTQAQLFLHYVDKNGPYSEWKDDKKDI
jgi:hypothetical protein